MIEFDAKVKIWEIIDWDNFCSYMTSTVPIIINEHILERQKLWDEDNLAIWLIFYQAFGKKAANLDYTEKMHFSLFLQIKMHKINFIKHPWYLIP